MIYAFGAYGTNNLGDDSIFLGVQEVYKDNRVVQVYINKASIMDSICYADIKESTITKKDILLIGGGGLLHCKNAVIDYLKIAKYAKNNGAKVYIKRIGTEGLREDYIKETKELFNLANEISVRSNKSLEYLNYNKINTDKIKVEKDFAYEINFKGRIRTMELRESLTKKFAHPEWPLIGLITAGNREGVATIAWITSQLLLDGINCNIIHIPHSRAYVSTANNDVITGELIWSSINIYHSNRIWRYHPLEMPDNPYNLYDIYCQLDGIIGMRYHSFIFSKIANKPLLGIVHGDKALAFFDESKYGNFIFSDRSKEEILEQCKVFISTIKTNGK